MEASQLPTNIIPTPWASDATSTYVLPIPVTQPSPQIPNWAQGWPADNFTSIGAGGFGPDGRYMNGILLTLSSWVQWYMAGGPIQFNSAFSAAVGGYPKGAILQSTVTAGLEWLCTADNNTTNPDGGSPANWTAQGAGSSLSGDVAGPLTATVIQNGVVSSAKIANNAVGISQLLQSAGPGILSRLVAGTGNLALNSLTSLAAALGFALTDGSSGGTTWWQLALPFGLYLQFGYYLASITTEGYTYVPLGAAFPTATLWFNGNGINNSGASTYNLFPQVDEAGASTVQIPFYCQKISTDPAGLDGIAWMAIGN